VTTKDPPASSTSTVLSKLGSAGTTVGGINLATLLFIGWEAKGAAENVLDQIESTRVEVEAKVQGMSERLDSLDKAVGELSDDAKAQAEMATQVRAIEKDLETLRRKLDELEACAKDRRKCS
jgi:peptidoglycan hydrolase CwlO-like protein